MSQVIPFFKKLLIIKKKERWYNFEYFTTTITFSLVVSETSFVLSILQLKKFS